jgi:hypothetical protein
MARYDRILGGGNVTVQAPPDFWTAAKQSFDDDYDRLVAAEQRKDIKEQQSLENNRAERQLIMQEEQAATQEEAEGRQKFMNELEMFTDPNQKAMWAKRTGVSKGWVSREQVQEWEDEGVADKSYESLRKSFLSGDAETRSLLWGNLREKALDAKVPTPEIKWVEEWGKAADEKVGMKAALEFAFADMPESIQESMRSIIETGFINEKTMDVIEAKLKASSEYSSDVRKGKVDLLKSIRSNVAGLGIDAPESTRNRFQLIELQLTADLERTRAVKDDRDIEYPTLGAIDEKTTGLKNTFDDMDEKRKKAEFKRVLIEVVPGGEEAWGEMDNAERAEKGVEIIDIINKHEFEPPPVVPGVGIAGEYVDPEYKGEESITNEMIDARFEEILKKRGIIGNRRRMASKDTLKKYRDQAKSQLLKEIRKKSLKKAKKAARGPYPPPGKYSFIYDE